MWLEPRQGLLSFAEMPLKERKSLASVLCTLDDGHNVQWVATTLLNLGYDPRTLLNTEPYPNLNVGVDRLLNQSSRENDLDFQASCIYYGWLGLLDVLAARDAGTRQTQTQTQAQHTALFPALTAIVSTFQLSLQDMCEQPVCLMKTLTNMETGKCLLETLFLFAVQHINDIDDTGAVLTCASKFIAALGIMYPRLPNGLLFNMCRSVGSNDTRISKTRMMWLHASSRFHNDNLDVLDAGFDAWYMNDIELNDVRCVIDKAKKVS